MVGIATVFLDESGTHVGSPIMSVGGTLLLNGHVRAFEKSWKKHLAQENLPYFHMTDLQFVGGHYRDWSRERRDNHARKLISLAQKHCEYNFCVSLSEEHYKRFGLKAFNKSSYSFALFVCLMAVGQWRLTSGFSGQIKLILEDGHESKSEALKYLSDMSNFLPNDYYDITFGFAKKSQSLPLHIADMIAWLHRHATIRHEDGRAVRPDYLALLNQRITGKASSMIYLDEGWMRSSAIAAYGYTDLAQLLKPPMHEFLIPGSHTFSLVAPLVSNSFFVGK